MKALVFEANALSLKNDLQAPEPGPNDALIRVTQAGVCNTDLEIVKGYMGFEGILGHEFVGVVEQCASQPEWVGKRVCADINAACGVCPVCVEEKDPHHCPNRTVIGIVNHGGAFADYVVAPVANLYSVPDSVSDDEAVFTEPVAAAFEIPYQMRLRSDDRVIVLGDGKLGLLIAQVIRLHCDEVLLFGKHDAKMALLAPQGVRPVNVSHEPDISRWQKWAHVTVDATGSAKGLETAMQLTRPRGTIVLKSTVADGVPLNLAPLVIDELTLLGSRCGPFDKALAAMEKKQLTLQPLIQHRFSLQDGVAAVQQAAVRGTLKVVLTP